eukprot:scaffold99346_cov30-Tisochrysis_lutea.AAC.1
MASPLAVLSLAASAIVAGGTGVRGVPCVRACVGGGPPVTRLAAPRLSEPSALHDATVEDMESERDGGWRSFAQRMGVQAPKLSVRATLAEERGKGGVFAAEDIAELEVIARIPRSLVLSPSAEAVAAAANANVPSWAAELTAEALIRSSVRSFSSGVCEDGITWQHGGGWATDGADLGNEDVRWGQRDVTGTLLSTGSDNDHNIYAKFRFPCHPVIHRAGLGLAALTRCESSKKAIDALVNRGRYYRGMVDALLPLIPEPSSRWERGSLRERRSWDVADTLSRVLARATELQLDGAENAPPTCVIVPLHERLEHCGTRGGNAKLVGRDPRLSGGSDRGRNDEVLLVATRAIRKGEAITRDYEAAPRLPEDLTNGALRLLLQFGLPPSAWPTQNL